MRNVYMFMLSPIAWHGFWSVLSDNWYNCLNVEYSRVTESKHAHGENIWKLVLLIHARFENVKTICITITSSELSIVITYVYAKNSAPRADRGFLNDVQNINSNFDITMWAGIYNFLMHRGVCFIEIISFKITRCKLTEVTGPLVPLEI